MFSDNEQISIRQVFRLFVFDFIGMSTLVLPAELSAFSGTDGIWSIAAGGGLASLYLLYLSKVVKEMDCDLITYMEKRLPAFVKDIILVFLAGHCILVAGYTSYVFSDVMKTSLVIGESYHLILVLILAVSAYAVWGGMESRARVYEVLFWLLFVPLFLMLLLAVRDVEMENFLPVFSASLSSVWNGSLLVFYCLLPLFLVLLFPVYVGKGKRDKMIHGVLGAIWFALGILALLYVILLGNFGSPSLAGMDYPAVTLMSSIELKGNFLKRLDAFMIGIWFFTLFALVNVFVFFGQELMLKLLGSHTKGKKGIVCAAALFLVFLAAEIFHAVEDHSFFVDYIRYIGMPLLLVLPAAVVLFGKAVKRRNEQENS